MGDWIRFFIGTPKRFLLVMAIFLVAYFLHNPLPILVDSGNPTPESLSSKLGISVSVIEEFLSLDFNLDPELFKEGERMEFLDKLAYGEIQSGSYPDYLKDRREKRESEEERYKGSFKEKNFWSILKKRWAVFVPFSQVLIIILIALFMLRSVIKNSFRRMR